jgi:hypothetical protein
MATRKLRLVARSRATATLREAPDGEIYVLVQTREALAPHRILDPEISPEQSLSQSLGGVELISTYSEDDGVRLFVLRVSTRFWHVDRQLDITAGSDERAMLERLVGQESFAIVWENEGIKARQLVHEGIRQSVRKNEERFPELDRATWKELVAESEWRSSENWRPGARPRKPKRRTAEPPAGAELRFFARRSGALPRVGAATLAGVKLPRGNRLGGCWCTDESFERARGLASRLAREFHETGLWPLLWSFPEEPTGYMSGLGDLEWIESVDASAVLEAEWDAHRPPPEWVRPLGTSWPGLAAPAEWDRTATFDPFDALDRNEPARLLLAPCNRPADALTALGFGGVEQQSEQISAILRSWEERFGAAVVFLAPGCTVLAVEAPPHDSRSAIVLAAEHLAVAPRQDAGRPGALAEQGAALQEARAWTLHWRG